MVNYITDSLILNHACLIINPTCYFSVLLDSLLIIYLGLLHWYSWTRLISKACLGVWELCVKHPGWICVRVLLSTSTFTLRTSPMIIWISICFIDLQHSRDYLLPNLVTEQDGISDGRSLTVRLLRTDHGPQTLIVAQIILSSVRLFSV